MDKQPKNQQHKEHKEPKESLKECEKLRDEYLAGWQRAKADFLNYQKNEAERLGANLLYAKAGWLKNILVIVDNFTRATEHLPDDLKDNQWASGVLQIKGQMDNFLLEEGIEEINPLGEAFDPFLHEAVSMVEAKESPPETIVEVLEKGYQLNGQIIRPAKVKVTK